MAFQEFELNMIPHGDKPTFYASQYETGRPIIIDIMMGEDAFDCSELYIELHARKVDDNIVTLEPDSVDGNQVTFIGTDQLFACPGKNLCEVCLYADDTKDTSLGSLNFFIEVEPDPLSGGLTSETQIHNLYQQVEEITQQVIGDDYYDKTEVDDLLDDKANTADLATVATTGDYDDLINKPTIPAAQVQSDWSQADNTQVDYIKNKPDINAMIANALFAVMPVATEGPAATCTFVTEIAAPLQSVLAEVVATQAAGTPTPSNPLPISGYTEANITRCGVNLFDKANVISAYCDYSSRLIYNNDFKSVVVPLKNGVQYLFSQSLLGVFDRFAVCDSLEDNTTIYNPITPNITGLYAGGVPFTFTNSENKKYLICSIWRNTDTYTFDEIASTCQLELGSTASTYTAYNGTTYAVSWQDEAGTVYGGNLDLITGVLTVTHGEIDSYNGESINEPWLSSKDVYTEGGTPTTGAQVVYPLTMPITYQLTPVQVQALLGVNNVFNDTNGDTEVQYKDSIQHYIDSRV